MKAIGEYFGVVSLVIMHFKVPWVLTLRSHNLLFASSLVPVVNVIKLMDAHSWVWFVKSKRNVSLVEGIEKIPGPWQNKTIKNYNQMSYFKSTNLSTLQGFG